MIFFHLNCIKMCIFSLKFKHTKIYYISMYFSRIVAKQKIRIISIKYNKEDRQLSQLYMYFFILATSSDINLLDVAESKKSIPRAIWIHFCLATTECIYIFRIRYKFISLFNDNLNYKSAICQLLTNRFIIIIPDSLIFKTSSFNRTIYFLVHFKCIIQPKMPILDVKPSSKRPELKHLLTLVRILLLYNTFFDMESYFFFSC